MTERNVILNNFNNQLVSFIVLVVKQLLFRYKCKNEKPSWQNVMQEIDLLYKIELYNAQKTNKLCSHISKWKYVKPECTFLR